MTLTEAAEKTKKFLLYGGIFVGIILVGWMGFSWYYNNIYLPRRPIIQEPPNKEFGLLPKPHFPKSLTNSGEYSYSLDTPTGGLPQIPTELPRLIKVYFIPQLGATFLAPDRAKLLAKKFGFPNGPEIINPIKYRFTDELGGELLFDLENANFDFTRPIATNSPSFRDKQADDIGTKESLSKEFRSFLSN